MIKSYKELTVWQKGIELCQVIYKITENFQKTELYGLTNQIRRCAVSIPSNIAEGQRRGHKQEYVQFLRISFGSGAELETQLIIAKNIGYIGNKEYKEAIILLEEIMKMLNVLIRKLQPTT